MSIEMKSLDQYQHVSESQGISVRSHHSVVLYSSSDLIHFAWYYPREDGGICTFAEEIEVACSQHIHTETQMYVRRGQKNV